MNNLLQELLEVNPPFPKAKIHLLHIFFINLFYLSMYLKLRPIHYQVLNLCQIFNNFMQFRVLVLVWDL